MTQTTIHSLINYKTLALMYSKLHDVYNEAVEDYGSANLNGTDYDARISNGIKIIKSHEDNSIEIFNTARGGDYYKELSEEEYDLFFKHGWVIGVCKLSLKKYKERLDIIEQKMKNEINGRNNSKYISFLKETRKSTLNKYYNITQKLNQHEN